MTVGNKELRAAILFIVLALGMSGLYWWMLQTFPKGSLPASVELVSKGILRDFGPALAAIIVSFYAGGISRFKQLMASVVRWRVPLRLYVLAFLGPMLMIGIAISAAILFGGIPAAPGGTLALKLIAVFVMMAIIDGPLGEEIGWRGFLLPALWRRIGPISASLIVGVIWYVWHIPLYAVDGKGTPLTFLLSCVLYSLIFSWFFLKSRQSTFVAIILHNCSNYFVYISRILFPQMKNTMIGSYVFLALVIVAAIAATLAIRDKTLDQAELQPVRLTS